MFHFILLLMLHIQTFAQIQEYTNTHIKINKNDRTHSILYAATYNDSHLQTNDIPKCNKIYRFFFRRLTQPDRIIMSKAFVLRANALNLPSICLKNSKRLFYYSNSIIRHVYRGRWKERAYNLTVCSPFTSC